ncbi:hypothetical protein SAMN02745883_00667 [Caminicella sporogenes DSM 14501]|uniref:YceG-like family protein n=1 Tax=Caminicella sporogenes DSM 14501 TaxID=1121266 RepID=A0A1M6MVW7_9FIRM|nr:hypothetical protein [Caminicella sporogenes]RKD22477.1 hypothetical protein BET04_05440 [Caminicella sporogenes]SHJ87611.1 hypothetical protein SAMN02745883_00667 [Caminicella sporogenes DSM 14501]
MIERLKNFFYDCSDILLSVFIVLVMAAVISWKLLGSISISIDVPFKDKISKSDNSITVNKTIEVQNSDIIDNKEIKENNDSLEDNIINENTNNEVVNNKISNTTPIENKTTSVNDKKTTKYTNITIKIPKGTTGYGIAKILKQNGLITDPNKFIKRVEELKLAPKLRFGTFTIKSNSSLDDIIYIITGIKK